MKRFVMYALAVAIVLVCNQPDSVIDPSARLLTGLVGFALLFLLGLLEWRRHKHENDSKPVVSVRAEVTGRRSVMEKRGKYHVRVYYLTFSTEDGSTLEFEVSDLEFGRMDNGEKGTLEYRGWEYLGLRRYDLGKMEPVVEPEREDGYASADEAEDASVRKVNGVMTHELEE